MEIVLETLILCTIFTLLVYFSSFDNINNLYNYPPKIQEKVKKIKEYKNFIPNKKKKRIKKIIAFILLIVIFTFIMRFVNNYLSFKDGFIYTFIIFTLLNIYDALILDCLWFCHSKRFIIKGTEDLKGEYHNYMFHIKGSLKGELIGIIISLITGILVTII